MLDGPRARDRRGGAAPRAAAAALRRDPLLAGPRHRTRLPRPMPAAATTRSSRTRSCCSWPARLPAGDRRAAVSRCRAWYTREQLARAARRRARGGPAGGRPGGRGPGRGGARAGAGVAAATRADAAPRRAHAARARAASCGATRYELLPQHGWLALQQAWLDLIAAAFVRKTRFDPLHEAASEQRLWDGLPGWLAPLGARATR